MDISPAGLARNWLPQLPHIVKTSALSLIGRSPNAKHQDTLTEAIVASAKPILGTPASLLRSQSDCNTDWGIGRPWIAKYTIPHPPEDGLSEERHKAATRSTSETETSVQSIREAVKHAMVDLSQPDHQSATLTCPIPELQDVDIEWTFCPPHSLPIAPQPNITERQIYVNLMQNVDADGPTVLHMHGGAYCLMDPSTHRWTLASLAGHTKSRVMSVRYRLSPQNIFPSALIDSLQAYLSLLAPPPDAFHSPVPPDRIVISGDSSGGGLAASLLLLLVYLSTRNISIRFHGSMVRIPSPPCAGLALVSPWLDLTRSMPSTIENARYDIVSPPPLDAATPPFPPDAIWPTSPPRAETYTTANMTTHPLVSPLAAQSHDWIGSPPVYLCSGWEGFVDEVEVLARRIYQSSPAACVVYEGWEGMPHCFMMVPWNRAGREAQANWGRFCREAVSREGVKRSQSGTWTNSLTYQSRQVLLSDMGMLAEGSGYTRRTPLDDSTVDALMQNGREWRMTLEDELLRTWKHTRASSMTQ